MDLETVRKAIESLEGYPGNIGIMGGEPTLHPKFEEICQMFREMVPDKKRRQLWTSGHRWEEYKDVIYETFNIDHISFNDHSSDDGKHQPLLVAIKDIVKKEDQKELIDNCWVQPRWSASITPYGCYFCEVAAAMDIMFEGGHGWPIEKGWWNKTPEQYQDQVAICYNCGAMLPLGETSDHATYDLLSKSNLKKLKELKSPKVENKNYAVYYRKWTKPEIVKAQTGGWKPFQWRGHYEHCPEDHE
jgi:hypothetical protein